MNYSIVYKLNGFVNSYINSTKVYIINGVVTAVKIAQYFA